MPRDRPTMAHGPPGGGGEAFGQGRPAVAVVGKGVGGVGDCPTSACRWLSRACVLGGQGIVSGHEKEDRQGR